jgi:branched-chain amino acid transport system substrate-binding protein
MSKRLLAALVASLLVAAACGSKLTQEELLASDALGGSGGAAAGTGRAAGGPAGGLGPSGSGIDGDVGEPGGLGELGELAGEGTGAGAGGEGAAGPAGGDGGAPLPAEGNGGATDVGVTEDSIRLGLITTLTGPVPGLFRGAAVGTQACAARANASGGIYGRQLVVDVGDDQLNENQVRAQTERMAPNVFAFVGAFSLYDGAMVAPLEAHGVPDIGTTMQPARFGTALNFSTQPQPPGWPTGGLSYLKERHPQASQAVGFLGSENAMTTVHSMRKVLNHLGFKVVYDQTFSAATQDFTAHVFRMRTAGVRFLIVVADAATYSRVLQSADQQNLDLEVFNPVANAYDPAYFEFAGNLAEGTVIYANHVMYAGEDAASVPEVDEFTTWMARIDPRQTLDVFALYGWTSCLLFIDAATAVGPQLTREALLEHLRGVTEYESRGLLAPSNPAGKVPPSCYALLEVRGGAWHRLDTPPDGWRCDSTYLPL